MDWQTWLREYEDRNSESMREADPIAIEARIALADARTERTAAILMDQYHGALRQVLQQIIEQATSAVRSDEEKLGGRTGIETALQSLRQLHQRAELGRHLTKPWQVVLTGLPNVGKSTLINALVGYQRAIVHNSPGTTRDVVTATTVLDGWPIELADTAGLREGGGTIEQEGIARTRAQLAQADLVVIVTDATMPWTDQDQHLCDQFPNGIVVRNKCELVPPSTSTHTNPPSRPILHLSALLGTGIDSLAREITQHLIPNPPKPGDAVPFTEAQRHAICEAIKQLESGNPSEPTALAAGLGKLIATRHKSP